MLGMFGNGFIVLHGAARWRAGSVLGVLNGLIKRFDCCTVCDLIM